MGSKDAMVAVVAALLFGEDAGMAATDGTNALHVGGMTSVTVTDEARAMLAEAQALVAGIVPEVRHGITRYDLTRIEGR